MQICEKVANTALIRRVPPEKPAGVHFASISVGTTWPLMARYGRFFVLGRADLRLFPTRLVDFPSSAVVSP
jgi:hypothetical protein